MLRLLCLFAVAPLVGACAGKTSLPACQQVPGCEATYPACCAATIHCAERICQGVAWTCKANNAGTYLWQRGNSATLCGTSDAQVPGEDGAPPLPDQTIADGPPPKVDGSCACAVGSTSPCGPCNKGQKKCKADCSGWESQCDVPASVCNPSDKRACGNCNGGSQSCDSSCSWGGCSGEPCKPGTKQGCSNSCGDRTCSSSCKWGDCSMKDQYIRPSGKLCHSSNHCPGKTPPSRCVQCWLRCDKDGGTYEDAWCSGGNCQSCSPLNDQC